MSQRDAIGFGREENKQKGQWKKCCKGYESTSASRLTGEGETNQVGQARTDEDGKVRAVAGIDEGAVC